jgi:hypothetical protein
LRGIFELGDLESRQLVMALAIAVPVLAILQLTKRLYGSHLMA